MSSRPGCMRRFSWPYRTIREQTENSRRSFLRGYSFLGEIAASSIRTQRAGRNLNYNIKRKNKKLQTRRAVISDLLWNPKKYILSFELPLWAKYAKKLIMTEYDLIKPRTLKNCMLISCCEKMKKNVSAQTIRVLMRSIKRSQINRAECRWLVI